MEQPSLRELDQEPFAQNWAERDNRLQNFVFWGIFSIIFSFGRYGGLSPNSSCWEVFNPVGLGVRVGSGPLKPYS